jgi:hypothetical protein
MPHSATGRGLPGAAFLAPFSGISIRHGEMATGVYPLGTRHESALLLC